MEFDLLPTTVVGSYPQPDWLIDRSRLKSSLVPRVRVRDIWRVEEPYLEEAQDDATLLAVRDMERAGLDIVTDGEERRESYSNCFATALDGVDAENPGEVVGRTGRKTYVPRVIGPIRRARPVLVRDAAFLRAATDKAVKITIPGPFTMAMQSLNEHYASDEEMAMAYASAVNEEIVDLFAAGVDIVQLDEPWAQSRYDQAKDYAVKVINRALEGVTGTTAIHLCFGYAQMVKDKPSGYSFLPELEGTHASQISIEAAEPHLDLSIAEALPSKQIMVGVISMGEEEPETPEIVEARVRAALEHVPAERLIVAPDCGMKYLSREVAFAKLKAMVEGTAAVRRSLNGG
jgi:5-methyltetrahydropteroyltriglutamate--homocysteine methyltransferase